MHEITNKLLTAKTEEAVVTLTFQGGSAKGIITEIDFDHGLLAFREANGRESVFIINSLIRIVVEPGEKPKARAINVRSF